jgi:hypothetical protein
MTALVAVMQPDVARHAPSNTSSKSVEPELENALLRKQTVVFASSTGKRLATVFFLNKSFTYCPRNEDPTIRSGGSI